MKYYNIERGHPIYCCKTCKYSKDRDNESFYCYGVDDRGAVFIRKNSKKLWHYDRIYFPNNFPVCYKQPEYDKNFNKIEI